MAWDELSKQLGQSLELSNELLRALDQKLKAPQTEKRLDKLWPVIISSLVVVITTIAAVTYNYLADSRRQALETQKFSIEVGKFEIDMFKSIDNYDIGAAQVLLMTLKKSVDDSEYREIRSAFDSRVAQVSETGDPRAKQVISDYAPSDSTTAGSEIADLIGKFNGPDRLSASKRLGELYPQSKDKVVGSLIEALLPATDDRSYRVNLYVALTLGRIRPAWEGTAEQEKKIEELRTTPNYNDPTFKARVIEAVANYTQKK
ncbi:MAG TPA: hypothetical protein VK582_10245 [Pyrinomonadaceae bacterium]|nr:hypothetical protein [Pyrinomonadaceae bacterium]